MPGKKAISLRGLTQGLALTLRIILEEEGIEKIIVLHVLDLLIIRAVANQVIDFYFVFFSSIII